MKNRTVTLVVWTFLVLITPIITIQTASLTSQYNAIQPSIVEYISSFKVATKDLPNTIANQYKNISISLVKTAYVELRQTGISVQYLGNEKTVQDISSVKATVANDSFKINFNFTATVFHIVGNTTYHCSTSVPSIYVNYTKEVDFANGNIVVHSLSNSYTYKSINLPTCNEKIKQEKDRTRIEEAVTATEGSSIFNQLKKSIDRMAVYFNENAKTQHLSKLYETNPFVYDYYDYQIKINVSSVQAFLYPDGAVANGIQGGIINTTHAAVVPPKFEPNFTTFYSLQFIQNMIEYSISNYGKWKDIKMNRLNMRTRIFNYRLIDFEYIVPNVLSKYPKNYLADVEISCSVLEMLDSNITESNLIQRLTWKCSGSFELAPGKRVVFLDFYPTIDYTLIIRALEQYISVLVDEVQLFKLLFSPVEDFKIQDQNLAASYLKEGLFEFRVYTIGTFLKVNSINKTIKLVPEVGVWVG